MVAAGHSEAGLPQTQWIVEGFAGISAYNLEDPTLEKIIQGGLKCCSFTKVNCDSDILDQPTPLLIVMSDAWWACYDR